MAVLYESVIGLEVHAQIKTLSKAFCSCPNRFGAYPNTLVCPVCTGQPGSLPVLNAEVVRMTTLTGLALGCSIRERSIFARKNYFYPDLPKGYQISQYDAPICERGLLSVEISEGKRKDIGITRIHIEEDAGQLFHEGLKDASGIDYNRCGVPLMEIVTDPDFRSAEEVTAYFRQLRDILMYLDVCDGNMQEGSLRCDVNLSIRPQGSTAFGTRAEIKNMNSFRNIQDAIEYEIQRQIQVVESGQRIVQETRLWDVERRQTKSMRLKEDAHDYRYFPEPDLLPLDLTKDAIDAIRRSMPELPLQRRDRFISQYELPLYDADVLCAQKELATYFEACAAASPSPKKASNWIMRDLLGALKDHGKALSQTKITPQALGRLITLVEENKVNAAQGKKIFDVLWLEGGEPDVLQKRLGFTVLTDHAALSEAIQAILAKYPAEVASYKAGDKKVFGFFMGEIRKATSGQADMKLLNQLLKDTLERP